MSSDNKLKNLFNELNNLPTEKRNNNSMNIDVALTSEI